MISGTYYEYMCPRCGWFPSIPCYNMTKEAEEKVKQLLDKRIEDHNKKCKWKRH